MAPTKPAVLGTTEAMMVPTKPASEGATTEQTTDDVTMATNQAGSEQPGSEVVSMPTKLAASDKTTTTSAATATGNPDLTLTLRYNPYPTATGNPDRFASFK